MSGGAAPDWPVRRARPSGLPTILSAIANAAGEQATPAAVHDMMRSGSGPPAQLRALFGDVSLDTLERVAGRAGIGSETLHAAYLTARARAGAANPELDALLQAGTAPREGADTGLTGPGPT